LVQERFQHSGETIHRHSGRERQPATGARERWTAGERGEREREREREIERERERDESIDVSCFGTVDVSRKKMKK
jgi:hypothetical protein